jgi:hypothetical protein
MAIRCGSSANSLVDEFLQAGATGFMQKPFPCKKEILSSTIFDLFHNVVAKKVSQDPLPKNLSVLVVDDDRILRKMISRMIRKLIIHRTMIWFSWISTWFHQMEIKFWWERRRSWLFVPKVANPAYVVSLQTIWKKSSFRLVPILSI